MAGTLEVTEELCWMPAGWVFNTVLERMAAVLHPQEPTQAAQLLAARTEATVAIWTSATRIWRRWLCS
jgi:hypothetical protein